MQIQQLQKKAERLAELRNTLNQAKEKFELECAAMEQERDALQEELLNDMQREKVASIRVENGDMYTRALRKGISITNEVFARKWALEHNAFSVDKKQVAQMLGKADELPEGFAKSETAYISIRKSK